MALLIEAWRRNGHKDKRTMQAAEDIEACVLRCLKRTTVQPMPRSSVKRCIVLRCITQWQPPYLCIN